MVSDRLILKKLIDAAVEYKTICSFPRLDHEIHLKKFLNELNDATEYFKNTENIEINKNVK